MDRIVVSIVMGSDSDLPIMKQAGEMLDKFGIGYEIDIVSAHRTPEKLYEFASNAHRRGIVAIIAGGSSAWDGGSHLSFACNWCSNNVE